MRLVITRLRSDGSHVINLPSTWRSRRIGINRATEIKTAVSHWKTEAGVRGCENKPVLEVRISQFAPSKSLYQTSHISNLRRTGQDGSDSSLSSPAPLSVGLPKGYACPKSTGRYGVMPIGSGSSPAPLARWCEPGFTEAVCASKTRTAKSFWITIENGWIGPRSTSGFRSLRFPAPASRSCTIPQRFVTGEIRLEIGRHSMELRHVQSEKYISTWIAYRDTICNAWDFHRSWSLVLSWSGDANACRG